MDEEDRSKERNLLNREPALAVGGTIFLGLAVCMLTQYTHSHKWSWVLMWAVLSLNFSLSTFRGILLIRKSIRQ